MRRLPLASFGKSSIAHRLAAGVSSVLQATLRGVVTRRLDATLVSTSPPIGSLAAMAIAAVRRVPIKYWVMGLNPDRVIALGKITEGSSAARVFDWINRRILTRSADVVALDRFIAERLERKLDVREKQTIMPPWPHDDHLEAVPHTKNLFRGSTISRAGLSSCTPATTASLTR